MGIFSLLIIPFIILFIIIVGVVVTFLNAILRAFGLGGRRYGYDRQSASGREGHSSSASGQSHTGDTAAPQSRKVIGDDEGEYVDFEEVK